MYQIIVIDDEPSVIDELKRIISERSGYYSVAGEAYNVERALELICTKRPNVIFTDIKMPGTSGIELVKSVAGSFPEAVMIVISGYDNFCYVHDAFKYGVEDYLLKPLVPAKLLAMLDSLKIKLDNHRKVMRNVAILPSDPEMETVRHFVKSPSRRIFADIEQYVKLHIRDDLSIETICRQFAISQPYLSRIFKKYKNITYNDFIISVKIETAKALLSERQDLLIGTIATLSGFKDQFYFSKVFKQQVGITPSEFRRHCLLEVNGVLR